MTDIAWDWFEPIMNGIQNMSSSWGQTQRKQTYILVQCKKNHTKHDIEQIGVSDDEILVHFK